MAGLRWPSGPRAGRRVSNSSRFDGLSSMTTASAGRRSTSAANTCPGRSGSPGPGGAGGAGRDSGSGVVAARAGTTRASSAHTAAGWARTARSAVLRCTSAGSWLITATRVPGSTNGPGTNGYCRNAGPPTTSTRSCPWSVSRTRARCGGQVAGEERVVVRERGAGPERFLPHRRREPLRQRHQCVPRGGLVGTRPDDERRPVGRDDELRELGDVAGSHGARTDDPCRGRPHLVVTDLGRPVVHRHDHERRPSPCLRFVVGAGDRARHVLRSHRLVDPDRVLTREAVQPAGEEGLRREMTAVLLTDDDDDGGAIHSRRRERTHRIAETGGRVQDRERGRCRPRSPSRSPCRSPTPRAARGRSEGRRAGR